MGADAALSYGAASPATAPASGRKRKHADFATNPPLNGKVAAAPRHTASAPRRTASAPDTYETTSDSPTKKTKARPAKPSTDQEKRLRRFRPHPPKSFHEVYHRATTQRFYVLSRTRHHSSSSCPEEIVELTGSTGNIYTVTVARQPTCTCPHAREGNQCKHVLYVLSRVLRARYELVYQLALLEGEVREILEGAPAPTEDGDADGGGVGGGSGKGRRKAVEGDCPICFCELAGEAVVWCRAACGQNVHKGCFETWAATKRRQGAGEVTCPFCRSVWEGDEDMVKKIQRDGKKNAEGYVNVASQLGISTQRDHSTYSRWWSGHPESYRRGYY